MRDPAVQQPMKKPTYKDYQNYLQSYKNGTSGSLSHTSSSSSLQSTESETQRIQRDFKSYNERNVSIDKVDRIEAQKRPTMKSELFITINPPDDNFEKIETTQNSFTQIKQKFNNGVCSQSQITIGKQQGSNQNSANVQTPKGPISPKSAENNVVPDQMIYAKTAVLDELLTTSPNLKKVPPTFPKVEKVHNSPPPLPKSKPPSVLHSPKPFVPPSPPAPPQMTTMPKTTTPPVRTTTPLSKTSTTPPKIVNQANPGDFTQDQLLKELQTLVLMQEKANLLKTVPEPPSFVTQQLKAKYSDEPKTTTVVPVPEGVSDVDKSDPNVKSLVYNTYRGLLGAYNNKANNMVSTLPRNAVVQDKGVSRQVESMASTGCLNNINGRVNPKSVED